eukprot:CAMPEP_0118674202 /NCGR_PEP_ID=MMETSP0800-20121206/759_1 /TAXON_ID=210618 ORGANISM="Striatella unipunctata, Strain CCMP2910" /NCGR_SAMPLE_ID=MMETSP0800 /ASSEMBLY_ACC=CAM_ASM_000638 /LENGTH=224 /DNA_ID=CAMNT_0006569375 /DNA_START=933 /DNA_END=1607 /DNA_ORIENTATION=+
MRRGKNANVAATNKNEEAEGSSNIVHPYETAIKSIATVHTVEEFWTVYDFLVRPNDLPNTTDYQFFRHGIKPTWEDPNNSKGGKWIVRLRKGLASRYWEELLLALIGSQFQGVPDGEVCGAIVSVRFSEDIVSVWNRNAHDREITGRLKDILRKILGLPPHAHMEYKPHETNSNQETKSTFRNTQAWKPSKERTSSLGEERPRRSTSWGEERGKRRSDLDRSWR